MPEINLTRDEGRVPRLRTPPKACDTHSHVYGPRSDYPHVEGREARFAPLEVYRAMLDRLGIERTVIVQPSLYGLDNRCTLDAIAALGQDRARGTAVVTLDTSQEELRRLHEGGMRGIRISHGGDELSPEVAGTLARMIAPFGWVLQIQDSRERWIADAAASLTDLPVPLIFDHLGRTPAAEGAESDEFRAIVKLVETGRVWVKISGPYYSSLQSYPHYQDVAERVRILTDARPDRLLWALNWPHPGLHVEGGVDSAEFLDQLLDWVPDETVRTMILADNPGKLYGFDA